MKTKTKKRRSIATPRLPWGNWGWPPARRPWVRWALARLQPWATTAT